MGKPLLVELSEKTYAALQQKAEKEGLSPANLVASSLERQFGRRNGRLPLNEAEARARFERHFGCVDLGRATGTDNESIDNDLAREYGADPKHG